MTTGDVVVSGLGMVTPAGVGVDRTWRGLRAGHPTTETDEALSGCPVQLSSRVPDFTPDEFVGARTARRSDRVVQFAFVAVDEALADAGLSPEDWAPHRVGVVLGCADGGPGTVESQHRVMLEESPRRVSPLLLPMQLPNMLAGQVSEHVGATGPSMTVATACASGTSAIGMARDLLLLDRCDIVITGGAEAMITPLVMTGFAQMKALSQRHDDPATASRPFSAERDGFVAGEGAGVLVLERDRDLRARGGRTRARVLGAASSADAYHPTAPEPEGRGLERAVYAALDDAGVGVDEVQHVNAHGTSTPLNDLTEARMLHRVFGRRPPLVTSTKGVTGHMFGAAGAVEAAATVCALQDGVVPPTANLRHRDPEIEIDVVAEETAAPLEIALSESMGFGGQNAVVVLGAA